MIRLFFTCLVVLVSVVEGAYCGLCFVRCGCVSSGRGGINLARDFMCVDIDQLSLAFWTYLPVDPPLALSGGRDQTVKFRLMCCSAFSNFLSQC